MGKKVIIISSSLRRNSNSERLAAAFAQGAEKAGNETELISLAGSWDSAPDVCPARKHFAVTRRMTGRFSAKK